MSKKTICDCCGIVIEGPIRSSFDLRVGTLTTHLDLCDDADRRPGTGGGCLQRLHERLGGVSILLDEILVQHRESVALYRRDGQSATEIFRSGGAAGGGGAGSRGSGAGSGTGSGAGSGSSGPAL